MKHLLTVLSTVAVISSTALAVDSRPFEGKWSIDKKASRGSVTNLEERIHRQGGKLVIESKYDSPKSGVFPIAWLGIMVDKIALDPEGEQTTNQIGPYKQVSKTTIFANSMVTDWTAADPPGTVHGQWIRTLSDDGKRMTLRVKATSSDGRSFDNTVVLKKK